MGLPSREHTPMMGVGGAMMLWRLAWWRAFPSYRLTNGQTYTPRVMPRPRDKVSPIHPASREYYGMIKTIDFFDSVCHGADTKYWLNGGPR